LICIKRLHHASNGNVEGNGRGSAVPLVRSATSNATLRL
jgi:hypothetical protein